MPSPAAAPSLSRITTYRKDDFEGRCTGKHRKATLRELLSGSRPVTVSPDDYLDGIIERMSLANVAHLAVVEPEDGRLVGYIGWRDLMTVRTRLDTEERERVAFYRVR